jgi:hypothetical protein
MQTRLKKVKEVLLDWFNGHEFVNVAKFDDFLQLYMSNQLEHSCVTIDVVRVSEVTRSKIAYQFIITYTDRMYADRRNLSDIKNDTVRVFHDFIVAASNDPILRQYITGLTSGNIEMFTQRTGDLVAGGVMTVTLNIFSEQNVCDIPVNVTPSQTPQCDPVIITITDTDGTVLYTLNVASGGVATQEINDSVVELFASDGTLLSTTNVKAQQNATLNAPDATYEVETSQGIVASGSIPSGGFENIFILDLKLDYIAPIFEGETEFEFVIFAQYDNTSLQSIDVGGLTNVVATVNGNPLTVNYTFQTNDIVKFEFDAATTDTFITLETIE